MLSKNKLKYYRSLGQKKFRDSERLYIAEGTKIVIEAAKFHFDLVESIICTKKWFDLNSIKSEKVVISEHSDIKKISSLKTPPECIAILKTRDVNSIPSKYNEENLILALDSIRDPGNLGTIIRMADWFGIRNIICSDDTVDCYNPKVVQATMGAILRVNLFYADLAKWLKKLDKDKFTVYGTTLNGKDIYTTNLNKSAVIVMGNESVGISQEIQNLLDEKLLIPNYSDNEEKTESLNVSIATSIVLSEFRRVQNYSK